MKEKYLIFAEDLTALDLDTTDATVSTTTALVNPVSLLNATSGTDGIIEVRLQVHADHTLGSIYGTVAVGDYFTINTSGYTVHATSGLITVIDSDVDAVNGVKLSSTAGNNDVQVNLLKHIDSGTLACFPASGFKGMQTINATITELYFAAGTSDMTSGGKEVDVIRLTHTANKYKELAEMVNDAMAPAKSGAAVDFFIGGQSAGTGVDALSFNGNPAGITSVDIQLDS